MTTTAEIADKIATAQSLTTAQARPGDRRACNGGREQAGRDLRRSQHGLLQHGPREPHVRHCRRKLEERLCEAWPQGRQEDRFQ